MLKISPIVLKSEALVFLSTKWASKKSYSTDSNASVDLRPRVHTDIRHVRALHGTDGDVGMSDCGSESCGNRD